MGKEIRLIAHVAQILGAEGDIDGGRAPKHMLDDLVLLSGEAPEAVDEYEPVGEIIALGQQLVQLAEQVVGVKIATADQGVICFEGERDVGELAFQQAVLHLRRGESQLLGRHGALLEFGGKRHEFLYHGASLGMLGVKVELIFDCLKCEAHQRRLRGLVEPPALVEGGLADQLLGKAREAEHVDAGKALSSHPAEHYLFAHK